MYLCVYLYVHIETKYFFINHMNQQMYLFFFPSNVLTILVLCNYYVMTEQNNKNILKKKDVNNMKPDSQPPCQSIFKMTTNAMLV